MVKIDIVLSLTIPGKMDSNAYDYIRERLVKEIEGSKCINELMDRGWTIETHAPQDKDAEDVGDVVETTTPCICS